MPHYRPGFDYDHLQGKFCSTANYRKHLTCSSAADAILVTDQYTRNYNDQENGEVTRVGARLAREPGNSASRGRMFAHATAEAKP